MVLAFDDRFLASAAFGVPAEGRGLEVCIYGSGADRA
jgi:hypothetical protein